MPESLGTAVLTAYAGIVISIKARQLSRKPGFGISDREDLEQDLTTHLLSQAHHFDPRRGSANTFAARVIDSKVAMMLRERRCRKRAAGFLTSLEDRPQREAATCLREMLTEQDLDRRTGKATPADRAELISAVWETISRLSPADQEICRRLMGEKASEAKVARDLAISRRQMRKIVLQLRNHFTDAELGSSACGHRAAGQHR